MPAHVLQDYAYFIFLNSMLVAFPHHRAQTFCSNMLNLITIHEKRTSDQFSIYILTSRNSGISNVSKYNRERGNSYWIGLAGFNWFQRRDTPR